MSKGNGKSVARGVQNSKRAYPVYDWTVTVAGSAAVIINGIVTATH